MKIPRLLLSAVLALFAIGQPVAGLADSSTNTVWHYTLLPGSYLIDDCDICGPPTIPIPMQGVFRMRLIGCDPLFCDYACEVSFSAQSLAGTYYAVEGNGRYRIGGEVIALQSLTLAAYTDPGHTNGIRYFTNTSSTIERLWPMIKISLDQTNPTPIHHFHMEISAAPMREIWFSTRAGLTAGIWQPPTNQISGGDLISSAARLVKRNRELTAQLGIMGPVPDLGLKDTDVLPGGEIAFSVEADSFSERLGPLTQGDLLSDRGRVLFTNAQLIAAFKPGASAGNVGLDAVQVLDSGEVYFSTQRNFVSQALGQKIGSGDLLSSRGGILRKNADLLARFYPADPRQDYGLSAFYVWPSGEIWFATETGFADINSRSYLSGDLLSDQGYVVYRNLELVAPFQPLEDLINFGLDGMWVITDVTASPPAARCLAIVPDAASGDVVLDYADPGRVWQLERSLTPGGPWLPVSPTTTDVPLTDRGILKLLPQAFYRLRQW